MSLAAAPARAVLTVAVAGNPNSGKSTLINAIAGSRLMVGNWPGVTVEKKEAWFDHDGAPVRLVDLPGIYSLSPVSQEELIARDFLTRQSPDVVINVVDATNLERNLYLTFQLLELGIPVVVALNMFDEARAKGLAFNLPVMERALGARVIPTVSTRGEGMKALMEAAAGEAAREERQPPRPQFYGADIESAAAGIEQFIAAARPELAERYPLRWLALKILEGDGLVMAETRITGDEPPLRDALSHLMSAHQGDLASLMGDARYALSAGLVREALARPAVSRMELTQRIDNIVLSRALGIPIFFAAMWLMFKLTFDVSAPFIDWIDQVAAGPLTRWTQWGMGAAGTPDWLVSLMADGVIGGVGFVLVFVPVIAAMMFFITLLEGSGYMARAAFVMDRAMHSMGLHGKSFIPMLIGFGCNVPAIYATRTLENTRDRVLTALLTPLMSCSARLPVYVLFIGVFFQESAGTVLWFIYLLGILLAVVMGALLKNTLFRGEQPLFIMELPPYRLPTLRNLMIHTWEKVKHFVVKAGTVIFAASIVVWFLLNLPWGVGSVKESYLGRAGQFIAPVTAPLGFGSWEAGSALITGVIAKEVIVGTLGEIYALSGEGAAKPAGPPDFAGDIKQIGVSFAAAARDAAGNVFSTFGVAAIRAEEEEGMAGLKPLIRAGFTPLTALAFMAFVLIYMPCLVTAAAFKSEFGSFKWFAVAAGYELTLAWLVAFVIYQGGTLLGYGG